MKSLAAHPMKGISFFVLLKLEAEKMWPMILLVSFFSYLDTSDKDTVFSLSAPGSGGVGLSAFLPLICFYFLFSTDNILNGLKIANAPSFSFTNLEFFFTRAIHRASLFCAKSSLFLIICSMPLLIVWAHTYTKPMIKIELPRYTLENREASKQFYLTHFEGAYLQEPDTGKNEDYVVLPKGRLNQAVGYFLFSFTAMLSFQALLFAFSGIRWGAFWVLMGFAILLPIGAYSFKPPTLYEMGLGWITQHTLLAFFGVGVLTFLTQRYCCRRFVQTEIIS